MIKSLTAIALAIISKQKSQPKVYVQHHHYTILPPTILPPSEVPPPPPHGSYALWNLGCRCDDCKVAEFRHLIEEDSL